MANFIEGATAERAARGKGFAHENHWERIRFHIPKTGGRLTGKDLINVGIFTAIYFVVVFAVACLGFIPILMAAICGIIPLIAGIPYMLFLTRARKFGMITILGLLTGIIMFITGMGYFSIATGLVFGLIADLIWKSGSYASASRAILSHGVFQLLDYRGFLPFLITADTYLPHRARPIRRRLRE